MEVVRKLGGLHSMMGWDGPILTDSGGFQVFSLAHLRKLTEEGATFISHVDGSTHHLTPESAVAHQEGLGADVVMPLDVCVPSDADRAAVEAAVERTSRWAARCREAHKRPDQALFGIVQGGLFPGLRRRSVEAVTGLDFPGYAIGGLSVGESKEEMYEAAGLTAEMLPADRPRYLMGVGSPEDLVEGVARGIDMFDCVLPTRIARNGSMLVREGRLNVDKAPHRGREGPIEEGCDCYTCGSFSAGYVHHLFKAKELLAYRLATIHNLRFVLRLMEEVRAAVVEGRFQEYRRAFHAVHAPTDAETAPTAAAQVAGPRGRGAAGRDLAQPAFSPFSPTWERVRMRRERGVVRRSPVGEAQPPATAGTMLISSPALARLSRPWRKRTSSPLT